MTKNELIDVVAEKTGLSKKDVKSSIEAIIETITETLVKKDSISFIGFGTFTTGVRSQRVAKVPGTNKTVTVPATTFAKFKVGKALKEAIASAK